MKKAMIAASIVGAAAAGVIIYLTRKNNGGMQRLLDGAQSTADDARRMASRHLRKSQQKINAIVDESME
jgi:hypothetical protein